MRRLLVLVVPLLLAVGCLGTASGGPDGGQGGGAANGGSGGTGGSAGAGGAGGGDAGAWAAGNPSGSCVAGVPVGGAAVDTSTPTTVVGTGTPASCTFAQLNAAVTQGGIITFNCGPGAVTIPITATMNLRIDRDTVIDGARKITLDGQGAVQIFRYDSPNFQALETRVTLQHLKVINGKTTPTVVIPTAPAPCSQGFNDGEGGALYMRDGNLTVIDSVFENNQGALLGPDTGGGAIYMLGSKHGVLIVGSTFSNNSASNGGGVGCLFAELEVYNSLFTNNVGAGHDANNAGTPADCAQINNGQNELGSGGNGGAPYSDGQGVNVTVCGSAILNNAAGTNAFGGGIFFTSNNWTGDLTITDSTITGNAGGHWTTANVGTAQNAGTAVGTNCHQLFITNSTVQGYP